MEAENMTSPQMDDFEDVRFETPQEANELHQEPITEHTNQDQETLETNSQAEIQQDEVSLETLQQQYDELNDKYVRLFSEFDNYRKRTIKEKIELIKTASEEVITLLLPVLDDFERALTAAEISKETKKQFEGVALIYNKFKKVLEQKGLEEIQAQGMAFDTDYHEAMSHIPAPNDEMKGKVIDVIEKGYSLNGKVIRFAKVVVAG
ncbi:MAG: nucleotide exchange factor GrpE [Bacteroidales bacterium]|nr:nucleotide exchange factor GrpE [Bacteroidales bacterium]